MSFEKDHKELLRNAASFIKARKIRVEPSDLVNAAYIKYANSNEPYSLSLLNKFIKDEGFGELKYEMAHLPESAIENIGYAKSIIKKTSNFCRVCKEDKPNSAFSFTLNNGVPQLSNICKKCYAETSYTPVLVDKRKIKTLTPEEKRLKQNETQKRYRDRKLNSPGADEYIIKERERVYKTRERIPLNPDSDFWKAQLEVYKTVMNKY